MTHPLPLSVYIIARNEADRIQTAIKSARAITNDVVVVEDGHSTDNTGAVAHAAGARVILNPWPGFGAQKYFAEGQCLNDWVFCLDADEVITDDLAHELRALFAAQPKASFYRVRIMDVYPGAARPRPLARPYNVVRLFQKSMGRTNTSPVHDRVDIPTGAPIGQLSAPLWHYSIRSLSHLRSKYDSYTTLQSKTLSKPKWVLAPRFFTEYPMAFLQCYLGDRHFTGGLFGLKLAHIVACARLRRLVKLWAARP
jgi:glycosyltransferase involved in cell wall biosynthesis